MSVDESGERIRLLSQDVPVQTLRQVAVWLEEIRDKIVNELGADHPHVHTIGQSVGARITEIDHLTGSLQALQAEIETIGDQVGGI
jgi:hypothetical protein